jgi:hypothetical protein
VSEADAYNAYLVAVADERTALQAFYATDDAQPFDQIQFDEAQEQWTAARYNVNDARNAWYKASGDQHNPEKIRL